MEKKSNKFTNNFFFSRKTHYYALTKQDQWLFSNVTATTMNVQSNTVITRPTFTIMTNNWQSQTDLTQIITLVNVDMEQMTLVNVDMEQYVIWDTLLFQNGATL